MEKVLKKLDLFIDDLMEAKIGVLVWVLGFLSLIGLRLFIEDATVPFMITVGEAMIEYLHSFFFFILALLAIWLILSLFLKVNPTKLAVLMFWSAWLVVLPPLIDIIKTGGGVFWSFYVLDNFQGLLLKFVTFFGYLPSGIVYFGTRIVFLGAILMVAAVVYVKTRKAVRSLLAAFCSYLALFIMGSFPSWLALGYSFFFGVKKPAQLESFDIIQIAGMPAKIFGVSFDIFKYALAFNLDFVYFPLLLGLLGLLFFKYDKIKFLATIKNVRFLQLIYHAGLLFLGLGLGYLAYPDNFNLNIFSALAVVDLTASIWLAWIASVIVNDIYDLEIDKISNPERPLPQKIFETKEYASLGIVIFLLSLLGGLLIGLKFAILLFLYQFLAWTYSARPYRLKKFTGIATFVSSLASLLALIIGFSLFSGDKNLVGLSWRIVLLIALSLTLSLPIKDLKDIEGDKKYGVWTIPVLLGEKKGRLAIAIGVFVSFMLSVFLLNELRLFFWALIFGAASFLIVVSEKTNPRNISWWILATVGIYGIILVKIIFL